MKHWFCCCYFHTLSLYFVAKKDARWSPKMAGQKFSTISHKPIKIKCFKTENFYNENLLHNVYFKKLLYLVDISFIWLPLAWIIVSMLQGRDTYKYFTPFTGMRCYSLWLNFHNSLKLNGFFWWTLLFSSVHIFSELAKLHRSNFVVLHAICDMEHCHSEKTQLHPSLVSNCPSPSECI